MIGGAIRSNSITREVSSDSVVWYPGVEIDTCAQQRKLVEDSLLPAHQAVMLGVLPLPPLPLRSIRRATLGESHFRSQSTSTRSDTSYTIQTSPFEVSRHLLGASDRNNGARYETPPDAYLMRKPREYFEAICSVLAHETTDFRSLWLGSMFLIFPFFSHASWYIP